MVPIPEAASFDDLNAMLAMRCRARQAEHAGRHAETIGERLMPDTAALRALPAVPLEPCEKRAGRVSSTALVRYRNNDYSVPTRYDFQEVMAKGFVDEVVILCAGLASAAAEAAQARGSEGRLLNMSAMALDPIVAGICQPTLVDDCRRGAELLYQSLVQREG
jgi:hypothetical protein